MNIEQIREKEDHYTELKQNRAAELEKLGAEISSLEAEAEELKDKKARTVAANNQSAFLKADQTLTATKGKLKFKKERLAMLKDARPLTAEQHNAELAELTREAELLTAETCERLQIILAEIQEIRDAAKAKMDALKSAAWKLGLAGGDPEDGYNRNRISEYGCNGVFVRLLNEKKNVEPSSQIGFVSSSFATLNAVRAAKQNMEA